MSNTLLPPKATPLERAIAQVMERTIEPRISALWNAATCPLDLLPWLAHALGVAEWSESWPEQQRRDTVAAALEIARKRGTVGAVKLAMQVAGFSSAELVEGEGSLTTIQQAACTPGDNCWAYFGLTMPESGAPPTPQSLRTLVRMINQAKPVRSIMNGVWQPLPAESEAVIATEIVAAEIAIELLRESLVRNLYNGAHHYDGAINYNAQVITEEVVETIRQSFLAQFPAAAAFSLRQLRFSATRAINVRNDSSVSIDIGFDANGELDTASLLAHCGAGNGYVTKWYNQATNGASGNFVQATAAQQPRIVTAGVVLTRYDKPMIQMATTSQYLYCEDLTLFKNRDYNRIYFTLSKPDTGRYDNLVPLAASSPLGFGRVFLQFGWQIATGRNLFASAQTGASYNSAQSWYLFSDNSTPQFGASISTLNIQVNWNATASGISDICRKGSCTRHANDLVTNTTIGGIENSNSYNENNSNFTLGGFWTGSAIGYVSTLLGFNELIIYTDAAQHGNDSAISANIAAYF